MSVLESVDGLHTSPFGVIPKGHQTGKWRLIVDLSSPHGESVNDGIDKELCMLSYISVYDIVKTILTLIKGALMAKVDIKKRLQAVTSTPRGSVIVGHGVARAGVRRHSLAVWTMLSAKDLHGVGGSVGVDNPEKRGGSHRPLFGRLHNTWPSLQQSNALMGTASSLA